MKRVILYVALAGLCFGTMEVALKIGDNRSLDPFQLTFLRFFGGGLLLLPLAVRELRERGITRLSGADIRYLLTLGILCIPLSMLVFQFGLMKANATTAALMICLTPIFTLFFAHLILREPIRPGSLIAMAIGLFGVLVLINPLHPAAGNSLAGIALTLIGTVLFSLYSVLGKIKIGRLGAIPQTSLSFLFGSAVLLALLIPLGRPVFGGIGTGNILLVLYAAIVVTGLGYLFYFLAIARSDATTGAVTFLIKPAVAPLAAMLLLKETLTVSGAVGISLVLAASALNFRTMRSGIRKPLEPNHEGRDHEHERA